MWWFLVVLLLKSSRVNAEESKQSPKIINGQNANFQDFPYIASLRDAKGQHFCGGTILDSHHILTAAHCFEVFSVKTVVVGTAFLDHGGATLPASKPIIYPEYNPSTEYNDLAIVPLQKGIRDLPRVTRNTKPVDNYNNPCFIVGWGLDRHGDIPNQLQVVTVYPVPSQQCRTQWQKSDSGQKKYRDGTICTTTNQTGLAKGDSGGPLVCNGNKVQYGVLSGGIGGASGVPDMSTDLRYYNNWIDNVLHQSKNLFQKAEAKMKNAFRRRTNGAEDSDRVVFPDN